MKFFVAHYTPLHERRIHIIKELEKAGINDYTFILSKDRDVLTQEEFSKFKTPKSSEISLFYKHVEIFKTTPDDEITVVFEDDAMLVPDFLKNLDMCLSQLQTEKWDVLFAGACCNLHCSVDKGKLVKQQTASRGTCLYVLNAGVGKRLNEIFEKQSNITVPIDHWFNQICLMNNLTYYWSEPVLVKQGSQENLFESSLIMAGGERRQAQVHVPFVIL
jgi:hypothetical protein